MKKLTCALLAIIFGFAAPSLLKAQDDRTTFPSLPGRIAYVGPDQNIYSLNLIDNDLLPLTTDGSRTRIYRWPTWAADGRLAYFLTNRSGEMIVTEVFISEDGSTPGRPVYSGENEFFNYAYWSPQNCIETERCRDLAVLLSSEAAGGLFVELIRDGLAEQFNRLAGVGSPFYFSWSPDGSRMVWQRNNQQLAIYDAAGASVEPLPLIPGVFRAPAWSPIDDRLLVGLLNQNDNTNELAVVANGESQIIAAALGGPVAFSWSPDGNYVAYTDRSGPLTVVDAHTGETLARSPITGVFAFFWSPDSRTLAYVTLATPSGSFSVGSPPQVKMAAAVQDAISIAWSVLDISTGANRRYGAFSPTQDMLYMLVYFDQFAQSHRLWSPDSRYLIYAEVTPSNEASINLLDTAQSNTVPFSIASGFIGIWSFK